MYLSTNCRSSLKNSLLLPAETDKKNIDLSHFTENINIKKCLHIQNSSLSSVKKYSNKFKFVYQSIIVKCKVDNKFHNQIIS